MEAKNCEYMYVVSALYNIIPVQCIKFMTTLEIKEIKLKASWVIENRVHCG